MITNAVRRLRTLFVGALVIGLLVVVTLLAGTRDAWPLRVYLPLLFKQQPGALLRPPLAEVEFPQQVVAYPPDWPAELRYPDPFVLTEVTTAALPDGGRGWFAKLTYRGSPDDAASVLSSFFVANGWSVERHPVEPSGFVLLVAKVQQGGQGAVVIGPDEDTPHTKVLATIRF